MRYIRDWAIKRSGDSMTVTGHERDSGATIRVTHVSEIRAVRDARGKSRTVGTSDSGHLELV